MAWYSCTPSRHKHLDHTRMHAHIDKVSWLSPRLNCPSHWFCIQELLLNFTVTQSRFVCIASGIGCDTAQTSAMKTSIRTLSQVCRTGSATPQQSERIKRIQTSTVFFSSGVNSRQLFTQWNVFLYFPPVSDAVSIDLTVHPCVWSTIFSCCLSARERTRLLPSHIQTSRPHQTLDDFSMNKLLLTPKSSTNCWKRKINNMHPDYVMGIMGVVLDMVMAGGRWEPTKQ